MRTAVSLAVALGAAVVLIGCGGSPASPGSPAVATSAVSGVALSATSVVAGGIGQGTINLSSASAGGASISLTSSNPQVATVQTPVAILAGTSSATFTITAVAAGTATFTALVDGSSGQSPTLTVTARPVLSSISLSASSVVGGNFVTGTAVLTAVAPVGGAVVSLSGGDPVSVAPSVTVPAGAASATFTVNTRAVGGTTPGTITGSYGGATASAVLSVTKPTIATASFGVSGPTESETCTMANGGTTLNCTFEGATSTAPGTIVVWDWSYTVAATFTQTTSGSRLTQPTVNCSLLPAPPLAAGSSWFMMSVTLTIHDSLGNTATATNNGVRLLPQGVCGF